MDDLAARIEARADDLTPAERRAAEVVLLDPSLAAYATVAEVGARADTSGATVVRLAVRLGYAGWVELQAEARAGIRRQLRPAAERIRQAGTPDVLAATAAREAQNVHHTLQAVDPTEFARAVRLLADPDRTVRVLAGSAQDGIGAMCSDALDLLRPGVDRLAGSPARVAAGISHLRRGDVVVAVDLRRYERWVVDAARAAAARGAVVVALTDSRLSPLAVPGGVTFVVTAEGAGPFDSHVGTLALVNALVSGVAAQRRRPATRRLDRVEAAWADAHALVEG